MKHFKCSPLVFSHQNAFYLIKPAIVCFENKVLPKILSKHIWFANLNTEGSTGHLMTSFLPFTDIRKRWSYALNVNTAFCMHVFHFFVKIIAFCIKNAFK